MDKKKTWLPGSSALALSVGLPPILPELHNIPGLQYRECLSVPLLHAVRLDRFRTVFSVRAIFFVEYPSAHSAA